MIVDLTMASFRTLGHIADQSMLPMASRYSVPSVLPLREQSA